MQVYQVHRNSLAWMLVAQALVILPHVLRLPIWITGICIGCFVWRVMVYQGRWSYPGRLSKLIFVVAGIASLVLGYGTMLGVNPWVGLLILMFALKLLEMHGKRDAFIVILLGYFVALTEFLYQQGILWTLYVFACVVIITAALVGLNQTRSHVRPLFTLNKSLVLLLQSVPMMLVLFLLFPRLSPLWSVALEEGAAMTGVTDVLRPGDIANLTQSDELAFRVTFDGEVPAISRLYWRGLVLSYFDEENESWQQERPGLYGRSQHRSGPDADWLDNLEYIGDPVRYSIILEPTNQNWMFSLSLPKPTDLRRVALVRDYRFYSDRTIRGKLRYDLESWLDYVADRQLHDFWRYRYTLLPETGNPRSRALAASMRAEAASDSDYIQAVLGMYNQQQFVYTLKPPAIERDTVDGFLLDTRRGFCEHYAGSFVYLMRAAGIPARVVVGYLGGEYNPIGDYVEIRQYDAHAWAEVWLPDEGWVRIDPTSAVAPDRIERGLSAAVESEETFLADVPLSWMKVQSLWINEVRLQLSALSHFWDTFVVGYTPEMQKGLIQEYFGDISRTTLGAIMIGAFFGLLLVVGIIILARRSYRRLSASDQGFLRFCDLMAREGMPRNPGEGPLDYLARIRVERPELATAAQAVITTYVSAVYESDESDNADDLKKAIRAFRFRLLRADA